MKNIVIIGSGNVAEALATALTAKGAAPVQIFARNAEQGAEIARWCGCGWTDDPAQLAPADLYIISVTDRMIKQVAAGLEFGNAVVAHTAASVPVDIFPAKIRNRAVLYPLQSFTKGRSIDFSQVPILIEGNNPVSLECVRETAKAISERVVEMDSEKRAMVHVAAVFAGNFSNHMYTISEELINGAGFDFSLLKPLITECAAKAVESRSPITSQTGPAVRNDFLTKSRHCELLSQKYDLMNIYISISKNIWETSKKRSPK